MKTGKEKEIEKEEKERQKRGEERQREKDNWILEIFRTNT